MSTVQPHVAVPQGGVPVPADPEQRFDHLVTEDDLPVDNLYTEKQERLLTRPLYASWQRQDGRKFLALANVGLFAKNENPAIVPDVLLSMDVEAPDEAWEKRHRSYFYSEYKKPPEIVIEVVSNQEGEELGDKLTLYAQINVLYYIVWDPDNQLRQGRLNAFKLRGKKYERQKELWFPEVGLGLAVWHGPFEGKTWDWLRWCDVGGAVLPTGEESARAERERAEEALERSKQENQRAENEKQRAEQEKQRAEQEKQRADRLAAQLRALGVEPE